MTVLAQFSQRATWPPSAIVRQRSMADITFIWSRLTCPAFALRHAAPWSRTTPGRPGTRARAPVRVAFRDLKRVGTRDSTSFAAQWLACALPCRRFAVTLAGANARLGAEVVSLRLPRGGLAPPTPCRSPGALRLSSSYYT